MHRLHPDFRRWPIEGQNLDGANLAEHLGDRPTLLVFLRHLGCVFSRELVEDVRGATVNPDFPDVTFFHVAPAPAGAEFFAGRAPGAPVVADQARRFFAAMGLERGSLGQLFGPRPLFAALMAMTRGHRIGKAVGDPKIMPGAFLVRGEDVLWAHRAEHAGDQPDLGRVAEFAATVSRDGAGDARGATRGRASERVG